MEYTIEQEQYIDDPRKSWDHVFTFVCWHSRYDLGDVTITGQDDLDNLLPDDLYLIKPLYLYDHSGLTISLSPFSCRWDSGQVGYAFISRSTLFEEFGWRRITAGRAKKINKWLAGEVNEYDQYLTGDVWRFVITDRQGEIVDSCGGFFGHDYAVSEAVSSLEYYQAQEDSELLELEAGQVGQVGTMAVIS